MPSPSPTLSLSGISRRYPDGRTALAGLSLDVAPGTITGLIGLNGAGKTTAIRITAGLLEADTGVVAFEGVPRIPGRDGWKSFTGFVLDEPPPFPWMSAEEFLSYTGRLRGMDAGLLRLRTGELLEFLELSDRAEDPISVYSTGMRKKVAFAAAALHAPRLLVLDEPLEGIDALTAGILCDALRRMAARGGAVLISSHILDALERLSDRIAILHDGRLVLESAASEIRTEVQRAGSTASSLEALFLDAVGGHARRRHLSW